MKNLFLYLLLFTSITITGQTFNNPTIGHIYNKSVAITSIEILPESVKVNMAYVGSSKYVDGYITISPEIKLISLTEIESKLIKVDNIAIEPNTTLVDTDELHKFSLYFEKNSNLKNEEFDLIEDKESPTAFNFLSIELDDNEKPSENNIPKNDFFLTQIPRILHFLYYDELFIESDFDSKVIFDKLIETIHEENIPQISKIDTESIRNREDMHFAYTLYTEEMASSISTYYYNEDEDGKRINKSQIVFTDKDIANRFFNSITDWYGASRSGDNYALKLGFSDRIKTQSYAVLFFKDLSSNFSIVEWLVIDLEEFFKQTRNSRK